MSREYGRVSLKLFVKVKPKAKENKIERLDDTNFVVWVTQPPVKGKANKVVIELLSEYLKIQKSRIKLRAGTTSKYKIVEII